MPGPTLVKPPVSGSTEPADVPRRVERLLAQAARSRASDIHFEPTANGLEIRFRIDGQLRPVDRFDAAVGRSLVLRLMVLAQLLTYRLDVPQEGRFSIPNESTGKLAEAQLADGESPNFQRILSNAGSRSCRRSMACALPCACRPIYRHRLNWTRWGCPRPCSRG